MKKIGIVGGTAWLSTIEYYSAICRLSEEYHLARNIEAPLPTPEMCIESLDLRTAVSYIGKIGDEPSWHAFDSYHRVALRRLEAAGAELAVMAANTPHHRFAEITRGVGIRVINMFEAVAQACAALHVRHLLVLGTALTMNSPAMRETLKAFGIDACAPTSDERSAVTRIIEELQRGVITGKAEELATLSRVAFSRQFQGEISVCLACTELPLAFPAMKERTTFEAGDIRYVNTSAIHSKAAFLAALP